MNAIPLNDPKGRYVPLARLGKPLAEARLTLISSCGEHARSDRPLDVCHPFGRIPVPSRALALAP